MCKAISIHILCTCDISNFLLIFKNISRLCSSSEFFQIVANLRKIFQYLETNAHVSVVRGSAVFGFVAFQVCGRYTRPALGSVRVAANQVKTAVFWFKLSQRVRNYINWLY